MPGVGMILSGTDVVRRNLPVAFRQVYGEFLALRPGLLDSRPLRGAADLYSFSAMLEWLIGRPENALALCQLQMDHHLQCMGGNCADERLACFVQAWINAERLRLRRGEHANVRGNILCLLRGSGDEPVRIGRAAVSAGEWRRLLQMEHQKARVLAFCVVEGLRSFELAGDAPGALAFLEQCQAVLPAGDRWLAEARIVVLGNLGRWVEALRHALTFAETCSPTAARLFFLHAAELHHRLGQIQQARRLLLRLCPDLTEPSLRPPSPVFLRQIVEAVRVARTLELPAVAQELARTGWDAAERMGDEVFQIEAASSLAELSAGDERRHWVDVHERLRSETLYAQVAIVRDQWAAPPAASARPHEGRLFHDLVAAIPPPPPQTIRGPHV
jgi:hypothetical protein